MLNSEPIKIDPKNMYEWKSKIISKKGKLGSSFMVLIFLDENKKETHRKHRLIDNFSGVSKEYTIIAKVPFNTKFLVLGFRVNCESFIKSDTIIQFPQICDVNLQKLSKLKDESFDDFYDYVAHYKQFDLNKDHWSIVGGGKSLDEFNKNGKIKFQKLIDCGLKPESTLLDFGCGTGILIDSAKSFFSSPKNYVGMDIASQAIDFCQKKYPNFRFYTCNFTNLPDVNMKFDMICLYSVFTHMYPNEIIELLTNLKNYLTNSGSIIVSVHLNKNILSWSGSRQKLELNEEFFSELVLSADYSKIVKRDPSIVQEIFQIFLN